jgi:hypothetical protein
MLPLFVASQASARVAFRWQVISDEMKGFMTRLRKRYVVGLVGGSDFAKVQEQMGGDEG